MDSQETVLVLKIFQIFCLLHITFIKQHGPGSRFFLKIHQLYFKVKLVIDDLLFLFSQRKKNLISPFIQARWMEESLLLEHCILTAELLLIEKISTKPNWQMNRHSYKFIYSQVRVIFRGALAWLNAHQIPSLLPICGHLFLPKIVILLQLWIIVQFDSIPSEYPHWKD